MSLGAPHPATACGKRKVVERSKKSRDKLQGKVVELLNGQQFVDSQGNRLQRVHSRKLKRGPLQIGRGAAVLRWDCCLAQAPPYSSVFFRRRTQTLACVASKRNQPKRLFNHLVIVPVSDACNFPRFCRFRRDQAHDTPRGITCMLRISADVSFESSSFPRNVFLSTSLLLMRTADSTFVSDGRESSLTDERGLTIEKFVFSRVSPAIGAKKDRQTRTKEATKARVVVSGLFLPSGYAGSWEG